jgi:hypothetical protein
VIRLLASLENNERVRTILQEMMEHWHGPLLSLWLLGAGVSLLMVGLLGLSLWQRRRSGVRRSRPFALFWRVAARLRMPWSQRWMLYRVARHERLPSPLTLLLSAATLRYHGRRYAASVGAWRRLRVLKTIAQARRVLAGAQSDGVNR